MDSIWIKGGNRLKGEIPISGAKNAALTLMPCALLTDDKLTLANLPRLADVSLNPAVLAFAAALAMGTTMLFALLPAVQLSRTPAAETLKEGSRGSSGARAHVRRALVVCQVSLAVVLLVVEHSLVKPTDLSKVGLAFFTINGVISLVLGALGIAAGRRRRPA